MLADFLNRENVRGELTAHEKMRAVEIFFRYLKAEKQRLKSGAPFVEAGETGAFYVLERIESSLRHYRDSSIRVDPGNPLDVILS